MTLTGLLFLLFSLSDYCIVAIQNATLNFLILFGLSESLLCKDFLPLNPTP